MNNCERCNASYEPYKTGEDEDMGAKWCELPIPNQEPKGLCQFCNPKSRFYLKERNTAE